MIKVIGPMKSLKPNFTVSKILSISLPQDFLADSAERIMVLKIIHRRVLNRFRHFLLFMGVPTYQVMYDSKQRNSKRRNSKLRNSSFETFIQRVLNGIVIGLIISVDIPHFRFSFIPLKHFLNPVYSRISYCRILYFSSAVTEIFLLTHHLRKFRFPIGI